MKSFLKLLNVSCALFLVMILGLMLNISLACYVALGGPGRNLLSYAAKPFHDGKFLAAALAFDDVKLHTGAAPHMLGSEPEMAAMSYLLSDLPEIAILTLRDARPTSPMPGENMRWEARAFASKGDIRSAAEILLAAADRVPADPTLLGDAAEAFYASGDKKRAREILETHMAAHLTLNPVPWLVRAKFAAMEGNWPAADSEIAEASRRITMSGPAAAETWRLAAALHARAGRASDAAMCFDRSRRERYADAARLRAAILPDKLLAVWEADAPALRATYKHSPTLMPRSGRGDRIAKARAELAPVVAPGVGADTGHVKTR